MHITVAFLSSSPNLLTEGFTASSVSSFQDKVGREGLNHAELHFCNAAVPPLGERVWSTIHLLCKLREDKAWNSFT